MAADHTRWRSGYRGHDGGDGGDPPSPRRPEKRAHAMTLGVHEFWEYLRTSPLLWLAVTLLAYQAAYGIYRGTGRSPLANPVLISVTLIISVLLVTRTSYQTYFGSAQIVHFLIGPATVAMAIPLYAQTERLKTMIFPLTIALLVGSA